MISIALYEPEIPPNTGNIARLCAANGISFHIVGQPAFQITEKTVKRAGLDYWPHVNLQMHTDWVGLKENVSGGRLVYFTTKTKVSYHQFSFQKNDCLVFGPETRGLPEDILKANPETCVTIPMLSGHVRSLNLANSVSIGMYEALRQLGMLG